MIRTQIQLTEAQAEALKERAAKSGVSQAELVRQSIDAFLAGGSISLAERRRRALAVVGKYASDGSNVAEEHDRYLEDAYLD